MRTRYVCLFTALLAAIIALLVVAAPLHAATDSSIPEKVLYVGDSEIIECKDAKRTAIGDPVVADVVALSSSEILLNARSPGKTVLYVWDDSGRRLYRVSVKPSELDMDAICERISKELDDQRLKVRGVGNTVILEGAVSREAESSKAEAIAQAIVETMVFQGASTGAGKQEAKSVARPEGESFVLEKIVTSRATDVDAQTGLRCPKVVNLIQVERGLDEVNVRTMEVATAIRQGLGNPALTVRALPSNVVVIEGRVGTPIEQERINAFILGWQKQVADAGTAGVDGRVTVLNMVELDSSIAGQVMVRTQVVDINRDALKDFGVDWGRVVFEESDVPGAPPQATVVDQPWLIGQTTFGPVDLFGGGSIERFDPIGARVRALEIQNKAKVLSEPNLLVLDGREAGMLVGGEIPIPVAQSGVVGGAAAITIEYKEFGVRLRVQPQITGDDRLQLRVMPEVSTLDPASSVVINGISIPGLRTRRAETTVNVRDGQSLIIGGLLQNETAKLVRGIPVLSDLPVIGELFKSRSFVNNQSELVIIVTPQIVRPAAQAQGQ